MMVPLLRNLMINLIPRLFLSGKFQLQLNRHSTFIINSGIMKNKQRKHNFFKEVGTIKPLMPIKEET